MGTGALSETRAFCWEACPADLSPGAWETLDSGERLEAVLPAAEGRPHEGWRRQNAEVVVHNPRLLVPNKGRWLGLVPGGSQGGDLFPKLCILNDHAPSKFIELLGDASLQSPWMPRETR